MSTGRRIVALAIVATLVSGACSSTDKPRSARRDATTSTTQTPPTGVANEPPASTTPACLDRPKPTVVSGTIDTRYATARPDVNHTFDLRRAVSKAFPSQALYPFTFGQDTPANGACVLGGTVVGQQDRNLTWDQMKKQYDGSGMRISSGKPYIVDGFRVDNVEDGIDPRGTNGKVPKDGDGMVLRDLYFKYLRDDCVENDDIAGGQIIDSLFDGCNTGISERPTKGNPQNEHPAPPQETLTLDHVLLRLEKMPGPRGHDATVRGHGQLFKWSDVANKLVLRDSVFLVEGRPNGGHTDFPPGTTAERVTVVWLGTGAFPGKVPSGVTITTDKTVWDTARADWLRRHGCSSFDHCTRLIDPSP